jgi:hypothetical protein
MRNDVTHSLKPVAEQKTGRPVKLVLQRGGSGKRMFLVVFKDDTFERMHLPKAPRRVASTVNRASPDAQESGKEQN